ncbi:MAG: hypothetical protein ACRDD1_11360, partial [Planctomycetia bacterium]
MQLWTALRRRSSRPVAAKPDLLRFDALEDRAVPAAAALDPFFSDDGRAAAGVVDAQPGTRTAAAFQSDGKLLIVGTALNAVSGSSGQDVVVARLNPNGTVDTTFGNAGRFAFDFGANKSERAVGLAVQPNGAVTVVANGVDAAASSSGADVVAFQLTPAGTLDTGYGVGGKAAFEFSTDDALISASSAARAVNGTVLVAGVTRNVVGPTSGDDVFVFNIAANGALDASFDGDGRTAFEYSPGDAFVTADGLAVHSDGRFVVAGELRDLGSTSGRFGVARLNTNGSIDNTFSSDGRVDFKITGGSDGARAVAALGDGKIVVVGRAANDFGVARLNADGSFDSTFGIQGRTTVDLAAGMDVALGVAVQGDGKIVVGGTASVNGTTLFAVARLMPNGAPDVTFDGEDGKTVVSFVFGPDEASTVLLSAEGRIHLVGQADSFGRRDFAAVRFSADNRSPEINTRVRPTIRRTSRGVSVASLLTGRFTDADGNRGGIAVSGLTGSAFGRWQFSLNDGASWRTIGTVSSNRVLLLQPNARLRFVLNRGQNARQAVIRYNAWDRTLGENGTYFNAAATGRGGSSPFSLGRATAVVSPRRATPTTPAARSATIGDPTP